MRTGPQSPLDGPGGTLDARHWTHICRLLRGPRCERAPRRAARPSCPCKRTQQQSAQHRQPQPQQQSAHLALRDRACRAAEVGVDFGLLRQQARRIRLGVRVPHGVLPHPAAHDVPNNRRRRVRLHGERVGVASGDAVAARRKARRRVGKAWAGGGGGAGGRGVPKSGALRIGSAFLVRGRASAPCMCTCAHTHTYVDICMYMYGCRAQRIAPRPR
jgi:hypothetical protein